MAGIESSLTFEEEDKMKELPSIKYDQKNVCFETEGFLSLITLLWTNINYYLPVLR